MMRPTSSASDNSRFQPARLFSITHAGDSHPTANSNYHLPTTVVLKDSLPVQRGKVRLQNLQVLNPILFVAEQGCKWRGLPSRFGKWHSVYTRMNRWAKNGVLDRVFEKLQTEQIVRIKIEAFSLDSTSVKVHPDGTGALKKTDRKPSANLAVDGTLRFIWLPQMLERL